MRALPGLFCCLLLCASALQGAEIRNIAGTGKPGATGEGGPAVEAQVNEPFGLCRGPDGALYFCDTNNHRVRKIDLRFARKNQVSDQPGGIATLLRSSRRADHDGARSGGIAMKTVTIARST